MYYFPFTNVKGHNSGGKIAEHNGVPGDIRSYHVLHVCKVSSKSMHKLRRSRRYKFVSTDRKTDGQTDRLIPVYPLTSLRGV
jgi:hypothetical protein